VGRLPWTPAVVAPQVTVVHRRRDRLPILSDRLERLSRPAGSRSVSAAGNVSGALLSPGRVDASASVSASASTVAALTLEQVLGARDAYQGPTPHSHFVEMLIALVDTQERHLVGGNRLMLIGRRAEDSGRAGGRAPRAQEAAIPGSSRAASRALAHGGGAWGRSTSPPPGDASALDASASLRDPAPGADTLFGAADASELGLEPSAAERAAGIEGEALGRGRSAAARLRRPGLEGSPPAARGSPPAPARPPQRDVGRMLARLDASISSSLRAGGSRGGGEAAAERVRGASPGARARQPWEARAEGAAETEALHSGAFAGLASLRRARSPAPPAAPGLGDPRREDLRRAPGLGDPRREDLRRAPGLGDPREEDLRAAQLRRAPSAAARGEGPAARPRPLSRSLRPEPLRWGGGWEGGLPLRAQRQGRARSALAAAGLGGPQRRSRSASSWRSQIEPMM